MVKPRLQSRLSHTPAITSNQCRKGSPSFDHPTRQKGRKCMECHEATLPWICCGAFAEMSHEDCLARVRRHNLCLNCLWQGYHASQCKSTRRCEECHGKHHTLLHHDSSKVKKRSPPESSEASETRSITNHHTDGRQGSIPLMTLHNRSVPKESVSRKKHPLCKLPYHIQKETSLDEQVLISWALHTNWVSEKQVANSLHPLSWSASPSLGEQVL